MLVLISLIPRAAVVGAPQESSRGIYADYYFTQDDAAAIVAAGGATFGVGAELGRIGGNNPIWTFTGRARVPF